ncbi:MAG TPA: phosphotransferase [Sphingobium sp.]|nr:phosphotransferase [Sphingobium sp.]
MTAEDFYALAPEQQAERLEALAGAALRQWDGGWSAPKLIKHRENAVFSVEDADGRKAVLRVHRHAYHSDRALEAELEWMRALHRAGVTVPAVISARDGATFVHVTHPQVPEQRQVDILGWVPGRPVGAIENMPVDDIEGLVRTYGAIGVVAARIHDFSSGWTLPDRFDRHAWDEAGLLGPDPFWGRFWELPALTAAQVDLLGRARAYARDRLRQIGAGPEVYSLIHADLVPENVFVDGDALALIDFDDAGFGWHMFELATALFFLLDHPAYPAIRDALFAGYEGERPGKASIDQLPLFLFLRSTTYLGWVYTRAETETARELEAFLIDRACNLAEELLKEGDN